MKRDIFQAFFNYQHLVFDQVVKPYSKPFWNGEDIFALHVANHVSRSKGYTNTSRNNFAIPGMEVSEGQVLEANDTGISVVIKAGRYHDRYRSVMWHTAKTQLSRLFHLPQDQDDEFPSTEQDVDDALEEQKLAQKIVAEALSEQKQG